VETEKKVEVKVEVKVGMKKKEASVFREKYKETIPSILITPADTPNVESSSRQPNRVAFTSSTFDADPMLKDLPAEQKTHINNLIATHKRVVSNIKVVQSNDSIIISYNDQDKMTAQIFFNKCQVYFRSQGFEESLYHDYVGLQC